jgi:hypothetical protein
MNMKKGILLAAVILLSTAGFAQAQEGELSGTVDLTYLSEYIWRGFALYDSQSAIQPSIDLDLYGTGFGLNVLWSRANTGRFENAEEVDLTLSYSSGCFEYETYATGYTVGWMYYSYPDQPTDGSSTSLSKQAPYSDLQEFFASFSWPEICPEGVVPSYTIIKMWVSESGSAMNRGLSTAGADGLGGWFHILGLGYDVPVEDLIPDLPEQILHLSASMVYNDGVNRIGDVDHDWTHAVLGVSTDFDLGNDLTFTPGVYYQKAFEHTASFNDELWCSLSVKYAF